MPFVETRFISPTTLTTSASSALYTVPTGYSAIIKQLVVTNTTGTAATFTFYIGAASAGNALFSGTSVAANDTVIINLSQVLTTGEVLRALASTGSALNLTVSGVLNDGPLASTATYIADNAITVNKIADGSVTTAKIAAGAVDTVDIANNAVTQAKLASTLSATTVTTSALRSTAVPSPFAGQTVFETDTNKLLVWNGTAWVIPNSPAQNPTGLELVASGSFTSVTTASPLVLSDVLTTNYPHYKIVMSWTQATAGGYLAMRLRNSSGLISTSTYDNQRIESYTSSIVAAGALNDSYWNYLAYNYNLGFQSFFNGDITFATVAQPSQINGIGTTKRTGGGGSYIYSQSNTGMENTATVATGLNIWTDGGAMTGSYKLYGYRNS